jgi:hypothetical protein
MTIPKNLLISGVVTRHRRLAPLPRTVTSGWREGAGEHQDGGGRQSPTDLGGTGPLAAHATGCKHSITFTSWCTAQVAPAQPRASVKAVSFVQARDVAGIMAHVVRPPDVGRELPAAVNQDPGVVHHDSNADVLVLDFVLVVDPDEGGPGFPNLDRSIGEYAHVGTTRVDEVESDAIIRPLRVEGTAPGKACWGQFDQWHERSVCILPTRPCRARRPRGQVERYAGRPGCARRWAAGRACVGAIDARPRLFDHSATAQREPEGQPMRCPAPPAMHHSLILALAD